MVIKVPESLTTENPLLLVRTTQGLGSTSFMFGHRIFMVESKTLLISLLTLRLLMSYIYGAPSKARNANVVYMYGPTFGNAQTVSFYLLRNVSTLNQCREVSCVTFVCKHFAS